MSGGKDYISYKDDVYFYRNSLEFFSAFTELSEKYPGRTIRFYVNGDFKYEFNPDKDVLEIGGAKVTPMLEILKGNTTNLMRNKISQTKNHIFSKLRGKTLLSIGAGRGGDIWRWARSGYKKIVMVEPNSENRKELIRRLEGNKIPFEYLILDVPGQDVDYILKKSEEFFNGRPDVVSFMLCLSFFNFQNDSQLNGLIRLASFGKKVGILTQDHALVNKLFRSRPKFSSVIFRVKTWNPPRMKTFTPGIPPSLVSKTLYIHIPNSIVEHQEEYLVNTDLLIRELKYNVRDGGFLYNRRNNFFNSDEANLLKTYRWVILQGR